jgi:hypothetical protein
MARPEFVSLVNLLATYVLGESASVEIQASSLPGYFVKSKKPVLFQTRPGMAESEMHKDHRGAVFLLCEWPCFG